MKKSAVVLIAFMAVIAFISCEQNNDIKGNVPLEAAKTSAIKKAEPVTFTFKTTLSADKVEWTVSPNRNVQIIRNGYQAKILFGEAGKYLVSATDQITVARTAVTVDSSTYVPGDTSTHVSVTPQIPVTPVPPADTATPKPPVDTVGTHDVIVSLADDEFILTPSIPLADSLKGNGIVIHIESVKSYDCMNSVLFSPSIMNDQTLDVKILLSHVIQPGARFCTEGKKKVSASKLIFIRSNTNEKIEVELNGTTYSGSISKSGNTYNITWPYNHGIKFSKLTLTK